MQLNHSIDILENEENKLEHHDHAIRLELLCRLYWVIIHDLLRFHRDQEQFLHLSMEKQRGPSSFVSLTNESIPVDEDQRMRSEDEPFHLELLTWIELYWRKSLV